MIRLTVIAFAGLLAAASAAPAEDQPPGRYALQTSADGFVRLDTRTGAVSHCGKRGDKWFCEPFAEEGSALSARIDALETEVKALAGTVAELAAKAASGASAPGEGASPDDKQLDQALGFSETLMRRFFGMVREMKRAGQE